MTSDKYNTKLCKAYRFLSFDAFKKTIDSSTLRFSRIDTFNDPLDCSPYLSFDKWWHNFNGNYKEIIKAKNDSFDRFIQNAYVCCFCKEYKTEKSYLMWTHYGTNHTQMCFEIDFKTNRFIGGPSSINYSKNLAADREAMKLKSRNERGLFLATTKIKQWSYEKEIRLIVDLNYIDANAKVTFDNCRKHLFYPFDLTIISKIIFGVNSKESDEHEIISKMKIKNLFPKYEKLVINPDTLKLKAVDYCLF